MMHSTEDDQYGSVKDRVCFNDKIEWIESPIQSPSLEVANIRWWTKEDLLKFKSSAKELTRRIRKDDNHHLNLSLFMAHRKIRLMLKSDMQKLAKLPLSSPDQDLQNWCAENDGRRGLERYASMYSDRCYSLQVATNRTNVFIEQASQRERQIFCPDRIAQVSKNTSRYSRSFALFMGAADFLVAESCNQANSRNLSSNKVPSYNKNLDSFILSDKKDVKRMGMRNVKNNFSAFKKKVGSRCPAA